MTDNRAIAAKIGQLRQALLDMGEPDLFQCKGYDWDDMMGLLVDITPTPNPVTALEFAQEWGDLA